jgi:heterodisulfide reductase subunit A-like polyferredoxin
VNRIGVLVCHCGLNIAGTVDVERVVEDVSRLPGVDYAAHYVYLCSDPGQRLIREAIDQHDLGGIVIAACSPSMHQATFRKTAVSAGLNPYLVEIANIREQCAWVHREHMDGATTKAFRIIASLVQKARSNEPLLPLTTPLTRRALVIGGGVAGMQAALDIADAGYPVVLLEREATLGGHVSSLSRSYLNCDDLRAALSSMLDRTARHPRITVLTGTEVEAAEGYVGNFLVTVTDSLETAVRSPTTGKTLNVGAIVVATGYQLYAKERMEEYGAGRYPDVIDGLEMERMLDEAGPTGGEIRRPSDGMVPKEIVFVQCAGSRDPALHKAYCSKVCCLYVAKQAMIYRQRVPDGQAYVFYIDIRAQGKGYEEFVQRAMEEYGVLYLRGKVSRVFPEDGKIVVSGVDTLAGIPLEIAADLVVLATAIEPSAGSAELAHLLRTPVDEAGFFSEAHAKLRPLESVTAGIYLAGAAQFPKDIPETVAQACGAAAKVLQLFSGRELVQEPLVAQVDEGLCSGCGICVDACPYGAQSLHGRRPIAQVNQALCEGCGACAVACPSKACTMRNLTPDQIMSMVDALV